MTLKPTPSIVEPRLKVMQDASAARLGHSHRPATPIEYAGFIGAIRIRGYAAHPSAARRCQAMLPGVIAEDIRGVDGHAIVETDGNLRELAGRVQCRQQMQYRFRSCHSDGRKHQNTVPHRCLIDHATKHLQRPGWATVGVTYALNVAGILLVPATAIRQSDTSQSRAARRAVNRATAALLVEHGQIAAVIEMGVGRQNRIETCCLDRQCLPIALPQRLLALE